MNIRTAPPKEWGMAPLRTLDMTVGIGHGVGADAAAVGRETAKMAVSGLSDGSRPGWAIAFCGGRLDGRRVLAAMRGVWGDIPVVGGAAIGTITRRAVGYSGFECATALFPASAGAPEIVVDRGLNAGEEAAGERLGAKIRAAAHPGATVVLFYDSIRSAPPPVLHTGSRLVEGIYRGLGDHDVRLFGGGTVSDFRLTESHVFDGNDQALHAAVAVVLPPSITSRTTILHGCVPTGSFMEITRIDGAIVYELDGRPAFEALERAVGAPIDARRAKEMFLRVTLGEKHGDPFAPFDEAAYVNRLIVSADPDAGSLTLFEADFRVGSRVQFMARDNDLMFDSVRRRTAALMDEVAPEACVLGLYIDCAGRTGLTSATETEEAELVLAGVHPDIPVLGFYSGVEIAPLMGRSRPLDWTGVLTVFCRRPE